jgi:hypothetical protein
LRWCKPCKHASIGKKKEYMARATVHMLYPLHRRWPAGRMSHRDQITGKSDQIVLHGTAVAADRMSYVTQVKQISVVAAKVMNVFHYRHWCL